MLVVVHLLFFSAVQCAKYWHPAIVVVVHILQEVLAHPGDMAVDQNERKIRHSIFVGTSLGDAKFVHLVEGLHQDF